MTGKRENHKRCPLCGGRLSPGIATIPFLFPDTVVLIKDTPANICMNCHEPFAMGQVVDRLTQLLNQLRAVKTEVSIISYTESKSPVRADLG